MKICKQKNVKNVMLIAKPVSDLLETSSEKEMYVKQVMNVSMDNSVVQHSNYVSIQTPSSTPQPKKLSNQELKHVFLVLMENS